MKPAIRLLNDQCLVRLEEPQRMTSGLLYIPDNAQREDWEVYVGTVLATGPGRPVEPMTYLPKTYQLNEKRDESIELCIRCKDSFRVHNGHTCKPRRLSCEVKPGDRIQMYFASYGVRETPFIAIDDSLRIIRERNIQAVLNG